jgi:hypothetical protein
LAGREAELLASCCFYSRDDSIKETLLILDASGSIEGGNVGQSRILIPVHLLYKTLDLGVLFSIACNFSLE